MSILLIAMSRNGKIGHNL